MDFIHKPPGHGLWFCVQSLETTSSTDDHTAKCCSTLRHAVGPHSHAGPLPHPVPVQVATLAWLDSLRRGRSSASLTRRVCRWASSPATVGLLPPQTVDVALTALLVRDSRRRPSRASLHAVDVLHAMMSAGAAAIGHTTTLQSAPHLYSLFLLVQSFGSAEDGRPEPRWTSGRTRYVCKLLTVVGAFSLAHPDVLAGLPLQRIISGLLPLTEMVARAHDRAAPLPDSVCAAAALALQRWCGGVPDAARQLLSGFVDGVALKMTVLNLDLLLNELQGRRLRPSAGRALLRVACCLLSALSHVAAADESGTRVWAEMQHQDCEEGLLALQSIAPPGVRLYIEHCLASMQLQATGLVAADMGAPRHEQPCQTLSKRALKGWRGRKPLTELSQFLDDCCSAASYRALGAATRIRA